MTVKERAKLEEELQKIKSDPKYAKNFRIFPEFFEIAKMVAIYFKLKEDMPEIVKNTRIKAFGKSSNMMSVGDLDEDAFKNKTLGFSFQKGNKKNGGYYKERTIALNQYYGEQQNYDYDDYFAAYYAFMEDEERKKHDRLRREEVTSGNKILERYIYLTVDDEELEKFKQEHPEFLNMTDADLIKKFYIPQTRPAGEAAKQIANFFKGKMIKPKAKTQVYDDLETKLTVLHEFLHSIAHKIGNFWGGVVDTKKEMLHEGMTEYLTYKIATKNKQFFIKDSKQKIPIFPPYLAFVDYARFLETIFPGSIEDIYINGKDQIQKYKKGNLQLEKLINAFSVVAGMDESMRDDPYERREYSANKMANKFLELKFDLKEMLAQNVIDEKTFTKALNRLSATFKKMQKDKQTGIKFNLLTRDIPLTKKELKSFKKAYYKKHPQQQPEKGEIKLYIDGKEVDLDDLQDIPTEKQEEHTCVIKNKVKKQRQELKRIVRDELKQQHLEALAKQNAKKQGPAFGQKTN